MRSMRLFWAGAAACLLALAAAFLLAGRGSAASSHLRPIPSARSAPTLKPSTSSNTVTTVQRTFVSTTGSDSNACTATAPCRSFATAISKTTAGGEVVALDSGGYGAVGIGMAVTLVGAPGAYAAITASSGDGIDVEAGSTDTVVLRNLFLNGLGTGHDGINFTSGGTLQLENVTIGGFSNSGVEDQDPNSRLYATDVESDHNGFGFSVNPSSGTATANLDGVRAEANSNSGIGGGSNAQLRVSDCISSGNGQAGVGTAVATMVSGCQLSDNSLAGLAVLGGTTQIGGSTVSHNANGLLNSGGTLQSFSDNLVAGNTTDKSGTITTIGKS